MERFSKKRFAVIFCLALGLYLAASGVAWACGDCGSDEGCTPGYWKQPHHFDSWEVYTPGDSFDAVFRVNLSPAFPNKTLLQVLRFRGGGTNALARHAVAALLNAASLDVNYGPSEANVIQLFNLAWEGSAAVEGTKNYFEGLNERGCPLN